MKTIVQTLIFIFCTTVLYSQIILEPFEKDGQWGYKNVVTNKIAIPAQYDEVTSFEKRNFAVVKKGDKWGCVNLRSKENIAPQYDSLIW